MDGCPGRSGSCWELPMSSQWGSNQGFGLASPALRTANQQDTPSSSWRYAWDRCRVGIKIYRYSRIRVGTVSTCWETHLSWTFSYAGHHHADYILVARVGILRSNHLATESWTVPSHPEESPCSVWRSYCLRLGKFGQFHASWSIPRPLCCHLHHACRFQQDSCYSTALLAFSEQRQPHRMPSYWTCFQPTKQRGSSRLQTSLCTSLRTLIAFFGFSRI